MEFNYPKPETPWRRIEDHAKLCPECQKDGKEVVIKRKSFLCKTHYVEYRRQREKARIKQMRKEFPEHEINKPGTTDFGASPAKRPNGEIDFDKEAKFVHNEYKAVFNRNTPGYKRQRKQQDDWENDISLSETVAYEEEWMAGDDGWEIRECDYDEEAIKKKSRKKESATHNTEEET
jgi:hypothetical protein